MKSVIHFFKRHHFLYLCSLLAVLYVSARFAYQHKARQYKPLYAVNQQQIAEILRSYR